MKPNMQGKIYDLNVNCQEFISLLLWCESIALFARIIFSYSLLFSAWLQESVFYGKGEM